MKLQHRQRGRGSGRRRRRHGRERHEGANRREVGRGSYLRRRRRRRPSLPGREPLHALPRKRTLPLSLAQCVRRRLLTVLRCRIAVPPVFVFR